jgi:hypothetical protein
MIVLILGILLSLLAVGAVLTLWGCVQAIRDWQMVHRSLQNGARQVIVLANVRRQVARLGLIVALGLLYGARLVVGHPVPGLSLLVGFALVVILIGESIFDNVDRRLLYWFMRGRV